MTNSMDKLTAFLSKLEDYHIDYSVMHQRADALLVAVALPGERWEIEFFGDGVVEVERFISSGEIHDEDVLQELFDRYAEDAAVGDKRGIAGLIPQIG